MIRTLRRWFTRTDVRLEPRTISGREVAFTDGYSLLELERAGITKAQALAAGLKIDRDRASALGSNVMQLEKLRRARALESARPAGLKTRRCGGLETDYHRGP